MTQNEKDILLKDFCSRLPYGVKVQIPDKYGGHTSTIKNIDIDGYVVDDEGALTEIEWARPYLFPPSSMTEEQKEELNDITNLDIEIAVSNIKNDTPNYVTSLNRLNWLLKNHFDIYGLIPMNLAIDATGLNIY